MQHSTHGPILKNAVQKLLAKRGMNWALERGGGAFKVDALSGVDLYDKEAPTCGKVVVAKQTEFHQMAASRRRMNGGSYASTMAQHRPCPPPVRTVSVPTSITSPLINRRSGHVAAAPLPRHVALEDAAIQKATKQSVTELQLKQNMNDRLSKDYEREFQKAVSDSKLQCTIGEKEEREEGWEAQQLRLACEQSLMAASKAEKLAEQENYEDDDLRKAYEQSLIEAEERQQDDDESDEDEDYESKQLKLAYEQSLKEAKEGHNEEDEEEEQLRRAYELSVRDKQQSFDEAQQLRIAYESSLKDEQCRQQMTEKQYEDALIRAMEQSTKEAEANNSERNSSDDDLLGRALSESKAFAEKTRDSDLELLEKALQESMFYEENRKCYQEQEVLGTSHAVDLLDVAKTLSLKQQEEEALAEEEALKKAIVESMR